MRGSTIFLFGALGAVLFIYWYQATAAVCPVPLSYRLGEIDESFSISREDAIARIAAAEALWEEATNRDLFVYDEASDFTIDFVYDDRQQTVNAEATERKELDDRRDENEAVLATIDELRAEYETLRRQYQSRVASYEAELESYNQEVQRYNDRGGAPEEVFAELEVERKRLAAESDKLSATTVELNSLANNITALSERGNAEIAAYNRDVNRYNNRYGYTREFTQGDYQGDAIHIYTFTSDTELERVLAHEFGHALGIGHVEASSSLMYYLMDDPHSDLYLSDADLAALTAVCGEEETLGQRIRYHVRQLLHRF